MQDAQTWQERKATLARCHSDATLGLSRSHHSGSWVFRRQAFDVRSSSPLESMVRIGTGYGGGVRAWPDPGGGSLGGWLNALAQPNIGCRHPQCRHVGGWPVLDADLRASDVS